MSGTLDPTPSTPRTISISGGGQRTSATVGQTQPEDTDAPEATGQ